jgi:hypothetical protein
MSLGFDSLVLHLEMHEKLKIVEAEWELNVYFTWLTQDRSRDHRYMMHSWMVRRSMQWLPKNSRGFYRRRAAWPVVKMIYYMDSYYVASSMHKRLHYCFLDQQCMMPSFLMPWCSIRYCCKRWCGYRYKLVMHISCLQFYMQKLLWRKHLICYSCRDYDCHVRRERKKQELERKG